MLIYFLFQVIVNIHVCMHMYMNAYIVSSIHMGSAEFHTDKTIKKALFVCQVNQ